MITKTTLNIDEAAETLTGFEEDFIEEAFGHLLEELLANNPTKGLRALVTVLVGRDLVDQGVEDARAKAREHAMSLTLKQVGEFFPDDEPAPVAPPLPAAPAPADQLANLEQ